MFADCDLRQLCPAHSFTIPLLLEIFRSKDKDNSEFEFSVLSMRIRFGGRHFSKCACSERKTRSRTRPRDPTQLIKVSREESAAGLGR